MALGSFKIVDTPYGATPTRKVQVQSGAAASIKAGEFVKKAGTSSQYGTALVDGDLTIATDQPLMGLAATTSTDTASADGYVMVYEPLPGITYRGKAKSAAAADTQTEIDALCGDALVLDLTSTTWTVDTAGGDAATNAFIVVGGDYRNSEVDFQIRYDATEMGRQQV